jgi:hypothetical protein
MAFEAAGFDDQTFLQEWPPDLGAGVSEAGADILPYGHDREVVERLLRLAAPAVAAELSEIDPDAYLGRELTITDRMVHVKRNESVRYKIPADSVRVLQLAGDRSFQINGSVHHMRKATAITALNRLLEKPNGVTTEEICDSPVYRQRYPGDTRAAKNTASNSMANIGAFSDPPLVVADKSDRPDSRLIYKLAPDVVVEQAAVYDPLFGRALMIVDPEAHRRRNERIRRDLPADAIRTLRVLDGNTYSLDGHVRTLTSDLMLLKQNMLVNNPECLTTEDLLKTPYYRDRYADDREGGQASIATSLARHFGPVDGRPVWVSERAGRRVAYRLAPDIVVEWADDLQVPDMEVIEPDTPADAHYYSFYGSFLDIAEKETHLERNERIRETIPADAIRVLRITGPDSFELAGQSRKVTTPFTTTTVNVLLNNPDLVVTTDVVCAAPAFQGRYADAPIAGKNVASNALKSFGRLTDTSVRTINGVNRVLNRLAHDIVVEVEPPVTIKVPPPEVDRYAPSTLYKRWVRVTNLEEINRQTAEGLAELDRTPAHASLSGTRRLEMNGSSHWLSRDELEVVNHLLIAFGRWVGLEDLWRAGYIQNSMPDPARPPSEEWMSATADLPDIVARLKGKIPGLIEVEGDKLRLRQDLLIHDANQDPVQNAVLPESDKTGRQEKSEKRLALRLAAEDYVYGRAKDPTQGRTESEKEQMRIGLHEALGKLTPPGVEFNDLDEAIQQRILYLQQALAR